MNVDQQSEEYQVTLNVPIGGTAGRGIKFLIYGHDGGTKWIAATTTSHHYAAKIARLLALDAPNLRFTIVQTETVTTTKFAEIDVSALLSANG